MKALFIAICATFVFALVIIYHDEQRAKAEETKDLKIIVCSGTIVQVPQP